MSCRQNSPKRQGIRATAAAFFRPLVDLTLRTGESSEENRRKKVIVPTAAIAVVVYLSPLILFAKQGPGLGLLLACSVFALVLALIGVPLLTRRLSALTTSTVLFCLVVLICIMDTWTFNRESYWCLAIIAHNASMFVSPGQSHHHHAAFIISYLLVVQSENVWRWGLFDHLPDSEPPPAALGTSIGSIVTALNRIAMLLLIQSMSHSYASALLSERMRLQRALTVAGEVTEALVKFEIEEAECCVMLARDEEGYVEGNTLPAVLHALIRNLKLYRPYLPDVIFSDFKNFGDADDDISSGGDDVLVHSQAETFGRACRLKSMLTPDSGSQGGSCAASDHLASHGSRVSQRTSIVSSRRTEEDGGEGSLSDRQRLQARLETGYRKRRSSLLYATGRLATEQGDEVFQRSEVFTSAVASAGKREGGRVISFSADSALVGWNTHHPVPKHVYVSARTAAALWDEMFYQDEMLCDIGVASGEVIAGHVGTDAVRAAFVLGRPLVQARVLAALCSEIGSRTLVTETVYELIKVRIDARPVEVTHLDPEAPVHADLMVVYELADESSAEEQKLSGVWALFTEGFWMFKACQWDDAASALRRAHDLDKQDPQAARLLLLAEKAAAVRRGGEPPGQYCRHWVGWADGRQWLCRMDESGGEPLRSEAAPSISLSRDHRRSCRKQPSGGLAAEAEALSAAIANQTLPPSPAWAGGSLRSPAPRTSPAFLSTVCNTVEGTLGFQTQQGPLTFLRSESGARTSSALTVAASGAVPDLQGVPMCFDDTGARGTSHRWWRSAKLLGRGGFGEVWLGMGEDGALVALKSLRLDRSDASRTDELLREVVVQCALQHDNIVAYIGSAVVGEYVLIVMEYVSGGSMQSILSHFGYLQTCSCRRYVKDVVRGLSFLHSHKIVHRDLKPANILVQIDGLCKIADFGASKTLEMTRTTSSASEVANVVGTPVYMAPEACKGIVLPVGDVWAVGITVCQLLTGAIPYAVDPQSTDFSAFLYRLATDSSVPRLPGVDELGDADAADLVACCLQRDPQKRPQAEELLSHRFLR